MTRRLATAIGVLTVVVLAHAGAPAAEADGPRPFRGLRLRGVNYPLGAITEEGNFDVLVEWRVNVIRLGIPYDVDRPWPLLIKSTEPLTLDDAVMARIKEVIAWAGKRGIYVIVDVHSAPGVHNGKIWTDLKYHDLLIQYWERIAAECKDLEPVIGYDLLNEPGAGMTGLEWKSGDGPLSPGDWSPPAEWRGTPRDYDALMKKVAAAVRKVDPDTTIIVEGGIVGGMARNFKWLQPIDDANVVYSFHMYEPHQFAYQGIKGRAAGPSYPYQKGDERVDKSWLRERMRPVVEFQRKHGVEILLGEFSCARWTDDKGGLTYLQDVIDLAEEYGWHYCYHAFRAAPCWDAEMGTDPDQRERLDDAPRAALLKKYFARNRWQVRPE